MKKIIILAADAMTTKIFMKMKIFTIFPMIVALKKRTDFLKNKKIENEFNQ